MYSKATYHFHYHEEYAGRRGKKQPPLLYPPPDVGRNIGFDVAQGAWHTPMM